MNRAYLNPLMRSAVAAAITATLFVGCATVEKKPPGSERVRAKLTTLQSEPNLANAAPVAMKDADRAVQDAELVEKDLELVAHRSISLTTRSTRPAHSRKRSTPNSNARC
jgi:hypothetical protein